MRIVVDTNVLMSGIFFGGPPGEIVDAWKAGRVTFVLSPTILEEYRRVGDELESKHGDFGLSAIAISSPLVRREGSRFCRLASLSTSPFTRGRPNPQLQVTGVYVSKGTLSFVRSRRSRYVQHHAAGH